MANDLDVSAVGKEFVRQYYTVLNQRPDCLHQFFTESSSFVHGGYEKPGEEKPSSIGQSLIHQKVMSLGFHDCRTKIRQVDCQKTIGNAVLVQVSGELSKNGEAMRRFMQSFVLVQQTPKNFYVHNDIFRYQDEVFVEEEPEEAHAAVVEEEVSHVPENEHEVVHEVGEELHNGQQFNTAPVAAVVASQVKERKEEENVVEEVPASEPEAELKPVERIQSPQQPASKGFSWASMASKNVNVSLPNKPQAAVKPERKAEQQGPVKVAPPPKPRVVADENASIPDNQQLFIGNLSHNITENEIKKLFEQFGTVLNVKVNRKSSYKDVPNFGFVAFDSPEAVKKALIAKPIKHDKKRINIEEKKDQSSCKSRGSGKPLRVHKEE